jgi:hypothetical protein
MAVAFHKLASPPRDAPPSARFFTNRVRTARPADAPELAVNGQRNGSRPLHPLNRFYAASRATPAPSNLQPLTSSTCQLASPLSISHDPARSAAPHHLRAAGRQDVAHHFDLLQVSPGATRATRQVGRYRLADVLMTQRQIITRRIGLYGAMDAGQGPGPSTTGLQIKSP